MDFLTEYLIGQLHRMLQHSVIPVRYHRGNPQGLHLVESPRLQENHGVENQYIQTQVHPAGQWDKELLLRNLLRHVLAITADS